MVCLESIDLIHIGIIAYVGLWLIMAMRLILYCRKGKEINVNKAFRLYHISCLTRHWGWMLILPIVVISIFVLPKLYIVTQDIPRRMAIIKKNNTKYDWYHTDTIYTARETFFIDTKYVLFGYGKNTCQSGATYLMNETDSALALYSTTQFNGLFTEVDNESSLVEVSPHSFMRIDHSIHNIFMPPTESSGYTPKEKKNKSVTEWTIALRKDAKEDIKRIRNKIYPIKLPQFNVNEGFETDKSPTHLEVPIYDTKTNTIIRTKTKKNQTNNEAVADDSK